MTTSRVMRIAKTQRESSGVGYINVMRTPTCQIVTVTVAGKFRVLDKYISTAAKNTFLVVVKIAASDREVLTLGTNAGTIQIRNCRVREFDVLHGDVRAGRHPDSLFV